MRLPPAMSASSQQRMVSAMEQILDQIDQGSNPTEAAIKVAYEEKIPKEHLPVFCRTLNAALMESHRKTAAAVSDRLKDPELVDVERVTNNGLSNYGTSVAAPRQKAAFNFDMPPSIDLNAQYQTIHRIKRAITHVPPPAPSAPEAKPASAAELHKRASRIQRAAEKLRDDASCCRQRALKKQAAARHEFAHGRSGVSVKSARQIFEAVPHKVAVEVIDAIAKTLPKQLVEKSAAIVPYAPEVQPFESVLAAAEDYTNAAKFDRDAEMLEKIAQHIRQQLEPKPPEPVTLTSVLSRMEKVAAGIGDAANVAAGYLGAKLIGADDEAPPPVDVNHLAEVRSAKVMAELSNLMANDDIIKMFPPQEVIRHFNELATTAPNAVLDPSVVRPLLRKRLEGGRNAIDPHDTDLLLKLERGMRPTPQKPDKEE